MKKREWFKREFELNTDPKTFPCIIERIMGTPARLEEKISNIPSGFLTSKPDDQWSIQENIGHLLDLEDLLCIGRLDDMLSGKNEMRAADLTNQKTHNAGHNMKSIETLLIEFRKKRSFFVDQLLELKPEDIEKSSLHPRLKINMRVIDLCFFIAEHDDHHLAQMTFLKNLLSKKEFTQ